LQTFQAAASANNTSNKSPACRLLPPAAAVLPVLPQKERRLTGLHRDIEELLFDPDFKGAVGARCACCAAPRRAVLRFPNSAEGASCAPSTCLHLPL
jgi:hypothetical protein